MFQMRVLEGKPHCFSLETTWTTRCRSEEIVIRGVSVKKKQNTYISWMIERKLME